MCNFLHEPVTPIEEEGIAYKLFTKNGKEYLQFNSYSLRYSKNPLKEKIVWDEKFDALGDGFCMLMNEKIGERALKSWKERAMAKLVLCKIKYGKGVGKFEEPYMFGSVKTIAMCKEFQIIEEVA